MRALIRRGEIQARVRAAFASPERLAALVGDPVPPETLLAWLRNLQLLQGVPFNYLVPDEGMLPPESIRFFHLDPNWMDALVDGALSIGRNLTVDPASPVIALDAVVQPGIRQVMRANAAALRAKHLGQAAPRTEMTVVTGFLLRSSLVSAYPGMGAYAYGADGGELEIVRFERLGDRSDVLLCLIDGDAVRMDLHEAPEQLHYGIDEYRRDAAGQVTAMKRAHEFTIVDGTVTLKPETVEVDIAPCFRTEAPRTMRMATLAKTLAAKVDPSLPALDAAQLGFEMTQGVGSVSFTRRAAQEPTA